MDRKPFARMGKRRRVRKIARIEAGKELATRTQLAEIAAALGGDIPPWAYLLDTPEFQALVDRGQWPSREAIAEARHLFAQLDP